MGHQIVNVKKLRTLEVVTVLWLMVIALRLVVNVNVSTLLEYNILLHLLHTKKTFNSY